MSEWLSQLPFIRPPPGLPPAEAKLLLVRSALPLIGAALHVVQALVFLAMGLVGLALPSVISPFWFAGSIALIRRGHARVGMWLAYAEVALHFPFLAICLGASSGYPMYAFALATVAFIAMTHPFDRKVAIAYAFVMGLGLYAWDATYPPLIELSAGQITFLFAMNVVGVLVALVGQTEWQARAVAHAEAELEHERERSERLLRNVLPDTIAERLKAGEEVIADDFDDVSVLFADIVGFTPLSARLPGHELIGLLNRIFSEFDVLADRHGLEKIKTIGDAYMVVAGLPERLDDHAGAIARMALGMREVVREVVRDRGAELDLRIGIHSGPVVAGVIGRRKFAYDLWGDTVNTASRMESHGQPGAIQLSDATAARLRNRFPLTERGTLQIKGKGRMRTWWLEGSPAVALGR